LRCPTPLEWEPALAGFMPVVVSHDDWGRPWATPRPTNGSGDFGALALTQGFVELPVGTGELQEGLRHAAVSLVALSP
jgi:molybdopterin biosynthesis enzyme